MTAHCLRSASSRRRPSMTMRPSTCAMTRQYFCPSGLSKPAEEHLAALGLAAFAAVGAEGWGRADFMMDGTGRPQLLEVNTVPGMTDHSLVPMAAKAAGISFDELVWRILESSFTPRADKAGQPRCSICAPRTVAAAPSSPHAGRCRQCPGPRLGRWALGLGGLAAIAGVDHLGAQSAHHHGVGGGTLRARRAAGCGARGQAKAPRARAW